MEPTDRIVIDHFAIERDARRLRAEVTRDGLRRFAAWLRGTRTQPAMKAAHRTA